jgi:hypothetical protein
MSKDLSQLSDQELLALAGGGATQPAQPQQAPTPLAALSDEELLTMAEQQQPTQAEPSFLSRVGEAVLEFGPGLGELAAGGFQRGAELFGREDISGRIGEQIAREREQLTAAQKVGRAAGQIIGTAPVGAGRALIPAGAIAGGTLGALTPTEEGTREEAAKQIATGAALGAVGGAVIGGATKVGGAAVRGAKKLFTATKPQDILARRLPAGQTADLLEQLKTATPDSPVILPDIAGDEVRGLTRAVGKVSGGARDVVTDALEGRSTKAVERVSNQLAKDISNVDSYFGNLDDIAKARSEVAAPLYEKAFSKGIILDKAANKELFRKIAPDIKSARTNFRIGDEIADNSIVMLDKAKQSLDDKIGAAIRQGERQQARALGQIKSDLVSKLDELSPDYKKARQVFSDFSSIENAQQQGLQFSKLRPEELKRSLKGLSTGERDAFRIGVRENLQKVVSSTPEGSDPAKRIFGNSFKKAQLKEVFPDEKSFKSFEKRMIDEINAAETKFRVLGGSRTDINLADEEQFLRKIAETGGAVATGGKLPALNAAVSSIKNRFSGVSDKNAKALADILINRKNSISALENILAKENSQLQKRLIGEYMRSVRPELLVTQTITENAI